MASLAYYSEKSEDSKRELAILIHQANQAIGSTFNSLNRSSNHVSQIGEIQMLSSILQSLIIGMEREKTKFETLDSVCISLELKKEG